ncbi:MAG: hypothetical protein EBR82_10205 [Caulobacteraceae bacterium]|nr:hypothetical protein [Caulobacteraceae bacterium]
MSYPAGIELPEGVSHGSIPEYSGYRIVVTNPFSGNIEILAPAVEILTSENGEKVAVVADEINVMAAAADIFKGSDTPFSFIKIAPWELPDRRKYGVYRDAWFIDGDKVSIDIEKAKAIKLELLRAKRNQLLSKLDVPFLRAVETGEGLAEIKAQKDLLRALPPVLKTALDELDNIDDIDAYSHIALEG